MPAEPMPVTPAVVTWVRERAGFTIAAAATDFPRIAEWEAGEAFPSYPQLERMAEKFKVPVAVFFFPEPPALPRIEETFRTLGPAQFAEIPPRVRLLLRKARTFQMGLEELNGGRNPAPRLIIRDLAFRSTDRIEGIAADVRAYLGVTMEQQVAWADAGTALEAWRKELLGVGIYVFKDQFREPDYSGFCLFDDEFPIIYVNNTTAKTRQIFTLFHELAHLLFHTSGVDTTGDGFVDDLPENDRRIEVICNRMAACLLVPEETFDAALGGQAPTEATAAELARHFSVSREFVFRKFRDRDLITAAEYDQAARHWANRAKGAITTTRRLPIWARNISISPFSDSTRTASTTISLRIFWIPSPGTSPGSKNVSQGERPELRLRHGFGQGCCRGRQGQGGAAQGRAGLAGAPFQGVDAVAGVA